jgi:hypothetical protein
MKSCQPGLNSRFRGLVFGLVLAFAASPLLAQTVAPPLANIERQDPDIDIYALMSGKCATLKVAGQTFPCKMVGFFHGMHGRVSFTVVLDDPTDDNHIVSFSGENGQRSDNNVYSLPVDRVFLNSKDRPKADGMPVPLPVESKGSCTQVGSIAVRQISSISCSATDSAGKRYELKFEPDNDAQVMVRRIRSSPVDSRNPFESPPPPR